MTPEKMIIAKSLIAFAWADGRVTDEEQEVVDAVLVGLDADEDAKRELRDYAKAEKTLADIPVAELEGESRELLLTNAAILTRADGEEADSESELLRELGSQLGYSSEEAARIIEASRDGALHLPRESLIPEQPLAPSRRK